MGNPGDRYPAGQGHDAGAANDRASEQLIVEAAEQRSTDEHPALPRGTGQSPACR
jgi:hypothetical protein